jgi:hypothetical protein
MKEEHEDRFSHRQVILFERTFRRLLSEQNGKNFEDLSAVPRQPPLLLTASVKQPCRTHPLSLGLNALCRLFVEPAPKGPSSPSCVDNIGAMRES